MGELSSASSFQTEHAEDKFRNESGARFLRFDKANSLFRRERSSRPDPEKPNSCGLSRPIGTHELGHSLQLNDLYLAGDVEKTMYGYAGKGEIKKRTLHWDDKAGIKFIYGAK